MPCDLVPGTALQEYSAVVGKKAEGYLKARCGEVKERNGIRIGLAVGNWVMLEGSPAHPTPLARGEGHKSFKEAVLANCDEVFLISPLCKILLAAGDNAQSSLDEFNHDFLALKPDTKGPYERVELDHGLPNRVRLITTARQDPASIVYSHSVIVAGTLRAQPRASYQDCVEKPIDELPHFIYPHDSTFTGPEDQLKTELPHRQTRTAAFATKYFHLLPQLVSSLLTAPPAHRASTTRADSSSRSAHVEGI